LRHRGHRRELKLEATTLSLAKFLVVLTSLPAGRAAASTVVAAYRLRWQVELPLKRLKSGLGVDRLLARDPVMGQSAMGGFLPDRFRER
jgi:hypothetical protein